MEIPILLAFEKLDVLSTVGQDFSLPDNLELLAGEDLPVLVADVGGVVSAGPAYPWL
jgi:hypothetical protein